MQHAHRIGAELFFVAELSAAYGEMRRLHQGASSDRLLAVRIFFGLRLTNVQFAVERQCIQRQVDGPVFVSPGRAYALPVVLAATVVLDDGVDSEVGFLVCHDDSPL